MPHVNKKVRNSHKIHMQRKVLYRWDFMSLAASLKWSARVSLLDKVKNERNAH